MKRYILLFLLVIFFAVNAVALLNPLILLPDSIFAEEIQENYNLKTNSQTFANQEIGFMRNTITDCVEVVDLGLSVMWATCNVGAESPEDYGDYFEWGEVEPKITYSWDTYKYCKEGEKKKLIKYCSKSSYGNNGFTDTKTILDVEDDAATVNWGNSWRMPTDDEFTELREKCTWLWATLNGVNGYRVVGPNGNSIF